MNGVMVVVVSAVVLVAGYLVYGRWLANKWGVDASALTPAQRMEDGKDFAPASRFTVFAHQFSSIAGAGPVTGTIAAMMFGWLPVLLWVLVGGIFFGAVHDFGAMYASMKNNGKSLAQMIDKYIGRTGRRLFLLFCWLFSLIVIAAFTDMVAKAFKMTVDAAGVMDVAKSYAPGAAGTVSILFMVFAVVFGYLTRKFDLKGAKQGAVAAVLLVAMFALGMMFPLYLDLNGWIAVIMVYLVFASAMPIQTLKQPRDYLSAIMLVAMIVCAVLGIFMLGAAGKADMQAPMVASAEQFATLAASGKYIFPLLFVSVACGALSGFHSLVSSGTSSKQLESEKDMLPVGYGAMILESFVGVLAVVCAAIVFNEMNTTMVDSATGAALYSPFGIFSAAISRGMVMFGVPSALASVFMTTCVSALALTSLDAVARIGRLSFQEFFALAADAKAVREEEASATGWRKLVGNTWFATVVTLLPGLALTFGGYNNIWPLFGASNQLLGGMCMITLAVFCKVTGRKGFMLYVPVAFLLACTFTSLVQSALGCVTALQTQGMAVVATSGLQLVFAVLLMVLGVIVAYSCLKEFFTKKAGSMPDEEPEWTEMGERDYRSGKFSGKGDAAAGATVNA